jgi:NADH dehydrogenase
MKKTLLILGAGYSGLMTAIKLEENLKHSDDVEVVLVDRNDYHQYLHLAYEIATGVKKISDITVPMTELLRKRQIRFVQATVNEIDLAGKTVRTDKGDIPYYELVIALGSEPNYFHIKGAEELSMSISSVEDARTVRNRLKKLFTHEKEPKIVVGGGGFTGVELAGEIADEFKCCVTIIEASDTLLRSWDIPMFSQKVAQVLTEMGTELVFHKLITEIRPDAVVLSDGTQIECSLFIWTGGVQGRKVVSESGLKTGKGNRAIINEFCEAEGFPGVYVVGDCALVTDPETGDVVPQCIEIALQQAEVVAKNIVADLNEEPRTVYVPKFSGLIVAVGENYGIGKISGVEVEGRIAQMIKRLIHLRYVYEIAGLGEVFKETL